MGFLNETSKILDKTARVLNRAAFGNMRDAFFYEYLYGFAYRPIGLYEKSYSLILDHLHRNIGNSEFTYDGYGTNIGELANPFYNTVTRVPWFYMDDYKNSTSNYIEYIRSVYGATLSVENINNDREIFHISDDAVAVGYTDGMYAIDSLVNETDLIPNSNGTGTDTMLGLEGGYYNRETLRNAVVTNDKRNKYNNSITSGLNDYVGLTTENTTKNKTYKAQINEETGRFEDGVFSPLMHVESPVYNSNYGTYRDMGSYEDFLDSLGNKTKNIFYKNVSRKKYNPNIEIHTEKTNEIAQKTYFDKLGITSMGHSMEVNVSVNELNIRHIFKTLSNHSNVTDIKNGGVYVYTENEYGSSTNVTYASFNSGTRFGRYTSYGSGLTAKDLLKRTNDGFKSGSYKTIIARFHTDADEAESTDTTQTAVSQKYGMSHGRNLLKATPDTSEGYDNPYCRVWTFHHQYHRLKDAIRPLEWSADELYGKYNFSAFTADHSLKGFDNGRVRLEKYGTLNKNNGLVNITPIDNSDERKKVDIKNCMFSIENLAWKDMFSTDEASRRSFQVGGLSSEQKGPCGGRIMWFPPYDLKFNENVSVDWNETNFIGRGEGIYTYTNTRRTGNLSFKILVDHPAIIDYWENRGKSVSNSVDDVDDPEQQMLRFFAGCDMLTAKPDTESESVAAIDDDAIYSPDTSELKFFVFFPNNYSGIDDSIDFAMKYLTNGVGAGKERRWHLKSNGECYIEDEVKDYIVDYAQVEGHFGGYEMRPGKPISIVREQDKMDIAKGGYITDIKIGVYGNGVGCNDGKTSLYVQEGDGTDTWWQRKWYYRVDDAYKNHLLLKGNYVDTASYCLNSMAGAEKVAEHFDVDDMNSLFSLADVYAALEGGTARSVLDGLYVGGKVKGFLGMIKQYGIDHIECIGRASAPGRNGSNYELQLNRAKTVANWLAAKLPFDRAKIEAKAGGNGGAGVGINNGDDNSVTNKLWRSVEVSIHLKRTTSKTIQAAASESLMPSKPYQIVSEDTPIEELRQANYIQSPVRAINNYQRTGVERIKEFNDLSGNKMVEDSTIKDRIRTIRLSHLSDNINGLALNLRESVRNGNVNVNGVFNAIADFSEHNKYFQYDRFGFITNDYRGKSSNDQMLIAMHDEAAKDMVAGENNSLADRAEVAIVGNKNNNSTRINSYPTRQGTNNNAEVRYDNEAKFFSMLEKEEPFLHHKISDKVKYFDPAFHSISPEGFNARLTFLQQCTRQGPTIGNSDNYTADNTANNLAFGRPPVCILRIGDFYYTKILIDSLNIEFDPLMWDLNTEGIGVMPMIANISINFKFIGGSSLAGHITRLQNALSFNYYANTEVYDNRAELAEYDENGNIVRLGVENNM